MFAKTSFFLLTLSIVLLFQLGCKNNPAGPTNPRNYTWTIDTVAYPSSFQTNMRDIWGSSSGDIYVVGHNSNGFGKMFRYDGKQWKPVGLNPVEGGTIAGPIDLNAIFGFSMNNVWAVGKRIYQNPNPPPNFLDSSLIIHFNGNQWREEDIVKRTNLTAIWGLSSSNLWAGGWTDHLYHYDGVSWQQDSLPLYIPPDGFFQLNALEGTSAGDVFALGQTGQESLVKVTHYFFHKRPSANWAVRDSFVIQPNQIENKWGFGGLWVSPSGTLYSCGRGVHKWTGTSWEKLFDHLSYLPQMTGTSDNNIFVVGHYGTVLHFNGQDWYQYDQFANPDAVLWGVWADEREVFIVGHTAQSPQKTLIFHGK